MQQFQIIRSSRLLPVFGIKMETTETFPTRYILLYPSWMIPKSFLMQLHVVHDEKRSKRWIENLRGSSTCRIGRLVIPSLISHLLIVSLPLETFTNYHTLEKRPDQLDTYLSRPNLCFEVLWDLCSPRTLSCIATCPVWFQLDCDNITWEMNFSCLYVYHLIIEYFWQHTGSSWIKFLRMIVFW